MARITVVEPAALAQTAAARLTALIQQAIAERGTAFVSLTGGSTPRTTYEVLAGAPWRDRIDWSRVQVYWGDERHVPPDHADSNFGMAYRALLAHVPIPSDHVHRIAGELLDPTQAAVEYARLLPSRFDVMLLGLGEDCHIASIFPGTDLHQLGRVWTATQGRVTLAPSVILDSRAIVMLVAGSGKADAVSAAIAGAPDVVRFPGQLVREAGDRVEWILDRDAASRLSGQARLEESSGM